MRQQFGQVHDPDRDRRVSDAERFLDDRRREALAMIALWGRSPKPHAADELKHWRREPRDIDRKAARLAQRDGRRPAR